MGRLWDMLKRLRQEILAYGNEQINSVRSSRISVHLAQKELIKRQKDYQNQLFSTGEKFLDDMEKIKNVTSNESEEDVKKMIEEGKVFSRDELLNVLQQMGGTGEEAAKARNKFLDQLGLLHQKTMEKSAPIKGKSGEVQEFDEITSMALKEALKSTPESKNIPVEHLKKVLNPKKGRNWGKVE